MWQRKAEIQWQGDLLVSTMVSYQHSVGGWVTMVQTRMDVQCDTPFFIIDNGLSSNQIYIVTVIAFKPFPDCSIGRCTTSCDVRLESKRRPPRYSDTARLSILLSILRHRYSLNDATDSTDAFVWFVVNDPAYSRLALPSIGWYGCRERRVK